MNYFHDSGVILGYIFCGADRIGKQSYTIIEDQIPNHSGKNVWEECFGFNYDDGSFYSGKCGWLKRKIAQESMHVFQLIKKGTPYNDIIEQIKRKNYRIVELIKKLFEKYGQSQRFLECFNQAFQKFEAICYRRYCDLNDRKKVRVHDRRKGYQEIYARLVTIVPNGNDIEILIDGHHLATQVEKVVFVTGDREDIYSNKKEIIERTQISDMILLRGSNS